MAPECDRERVDGKAGAGIRKAAARRLRGVLEAEHDPGIRREVDAAIDDGAHADAGIVGVSVRGIEDDPVQPHRPVAVVTGHDQRRRPHRLGGLGVGVVLEWFEPPIVRLRGPVLERRDHQGRGVAGGVAFGPGVMHGQLAGVDGAARRAGHPRRGQRDHYKRRAIAAPRLSPPDVGNPPLPKSTRWRR